MRLVVAHRNFQKIRFDNISVNYTGSCRAKLKLSFVNTFTAEVQQLAGSIIVSAKSSISLCTPQGNKNFPLDMN